MPITRKQFELGTNITGWMKEIHDFLTEHKDEAFTEEELREHWDLEHLSPMHLALSDALERLREMGAAEKKKIQAQDYYSYGPRPLQL
jgi:hypothetical protein